MANITFEFPLDNATFKAYASGKFGKTVEGKTYTIKASEYNEAKARFDAQTPGDAPADKKAKGPADKKAKGHVTADKFLALIPKNTYIFKVNNKGHILISKADGDKTAYARIRPLKDGAWVFPGKELKATRTDWEYHKGWANEYALKVANWDEVAKVLNLA